jgi:hypothetical protein
MMRQSHVFGPPWHLNYFTRTTLRRLLLQKGFQVVDWLIESPTPDPRVMLNAAQQAAFAAFRAARLLTFGTVFPKPLLTCISRRLPTANVVLSSGDPFATATKTLAGSGNPYDRDAGRAATP